MSRYLVTFKILEYADMGEVLCTHIVVCKDLGVWWDQDKWMYLFPNPDDVNGIAITYVYQLSWDK